MQEADTVNACLEVLDDVVSKFGSIIEPEHSRLKLALLKLLKEDKATHRKRTLHCLGDSTDNISSNAWTLLLWLRHSHICLDCHSHFPVGSARCAQMREVKAQYVSIAQHLDIAAKVEAEPQ